MSKLRKLVGTYRIQILSLVAIVIFLTFVTANVALRIQIEGRAAIFGEFVHRAPGLHEWSKTWIGTQKLRHAAVYDGDKGAFDPERLSDRAFADGTERRPNLAHLPEAPRQQGI